jgi:MoaA/NifB/PqqE/SkfB family radical SAM enzyme
LRCKFCFNFWKDGVSKIPIKLNTSETIKALTVLFSIVDCEKITISGGEPLLREDLYEILSLIKSYDIPTVLTTNSTLLDYESISRLLDAGVLAFQVPFHSADEAVHDMLSGGECWRKTLKAFTMLKESGANVVAVFVATRLNLQHFSDVIEICSLLSINEIIFNRFIPSGLGLRNRQLIGVPGEMEIISTLLEANEKAKRFNVVVHLGVPVEIPITLMKDLDRISMASCPVAIGQTRWTIDAAGDIRRCNHSGMPVANLLAGGTDKWISEISDGRHSKTMNEGIQPCQILNNEGLVQIQHRSTI